MQYIVGIDECGRGPLVGSVVACAVMINQKDFDGWSDFSQLPDKLRGLNDSKKISESKRIKYDLILREFPNLNFSIGQASAQEIDQINILQASLLAMRRAVSKLPYKANIAYVDGNRDPQFNASCKTILCVKGDSKIPLISAASILAKVFRDQQMIEYDKKFPQYQFAKHKGYATKLHLEMLKIHGITPEHRKSFSPVKAYL